MAQSIYGPRSCTSRQTDPEGTSPADEDPTAKYKSLEMFDPDLVANHEAICRSAVRWHEKSLAASEEKADPRRLKISDKSLGVLPGYGPETGT